MKTDDTSLREALRASSEDFRKLEEMHGTLDKKLVALEETKDPSPDKEIEEKMLKKMKLRVKDEMYRMMKQYEQEQENAS